MPDPTGPGFWMYETSGVVAPGRTVKEARLCELYDQIDDARRAVGQARGILRAAEERVDELLADARRLMLTD